MNNEYGKRERKGDTKSMHYGQSLVGKKVIIIMQRCSSLEISGGSHLKEGSPERRQGDSYILYNSREKMGARKEEGKRWTMISSYTELRQKASQVVEVSKRDSRFILFKHQ